MTKIPNLLIPNWEGNEVRGMLYKQITHIKVSVVFLFKLFNLEIVCYLVLVICLLNPVP